MTGTACDTNTVTPLRQRMEEQLRIANLAASTSKAYICEIKNLARYYDASPDELDAEQVRQWYLGRIDKGLSPGTTNVSFAALNFLYIDTLGWPDHVAGLRSRKKPGKLPRYMSEQEVEHLILATPDLRHRAAIVTGYGGGLRISETLAIKVGDILSEKKLLHIPSGKGGTERMAPLPDIVHPLLARLLQEHLAASDELALLRRLARQAHRNGDLAGRLQEGARHCRARPQLHLPLPAPFGGDPISSSGGGDIEVIRDMLGHRSANTTVVFRSSRIEARGFFLTLIGWWISRDGGRVREGRCLRHFFDRQQNPHCC